MGKKRFIRQQALPYRDLLTGLITPVSQFLEGVLADVLLRPFRTAGRPLLPPPRGISWQVFLWVCICGLYPVERRLYSEAKRRDMDRLAAAAFNALWS
jgi:hypothetical protein